jgi:hypothetical protein
MLPHLLLNNPLDFSSDSSGGSLLPRWISLPYQPLFHCLPLYSCWLCLTFEGNQNEAQSGIRTMSVWPTDPLLLFLNHLALLPPPLPSPPLVRAVFLHCIRLGIVMWNGLTSTVILWASPLAQSRIWLLLRNQPWSLRHNHLSVLSPCHHPLPPSWNPPSFPLWRNPPLPWKIPLANHIHAQIVLHVHGFVPHGRYYTTWFLSSERMWTTCAFGWRTWTGEGKELNLCSQPCSAPCTLQIWQPCSRKFSDILAPGIQVETTSDMAKSDHQPA